MTSRQELLKQFSSSAALSNLNGTLFNRTSPAFRPLTEDARLDFLTLAPALASVGRSSTL